MKRWFLFFALLASQAQAQFPLSSKAEISLITCGPGQNELYSAFGHSAVRVKDPQLRLDLVFNYGIFDFDQPNFYLNFAKGHLLYMLATTDWQRFQYSYLREGRSLHEQVLNLDSAQTQAYFNFLINNAKPENRDYYYDYFYDNCATRIRDGLESALIQSELQFSTETQYHPSLSIRQLCDEYLPYQPWGDFAIDFCLGLPMDKEADYEIEMFLPDLLEGAFADAQIVDQQGSRPLVRETRILSEDSNSYERPWWSPMTFFGVFLVFGVLITLFAYQKTQVLRFFDAILFGLTGLLGIFLLALWTLTDHQAAAYNFNLLLFLPLHVLAIPALIRGRIGKRLRNYFNFLPYYLALLLATWIWLPQDLNLSLMPLAALMILRAWHISYKYPAA